MGLHEGVLRAYVFGELNSDRRWCLTCFSPTFERDAY